MKKIYFSLLLISCFSFSFAQTFTGTGGTIIQVTDTSRFNINVSGLVPSTIDYNFGLEQITVNITHPADRDVDAFIASPSGQLIMLTTDNGSTGANYTNTIFRWDASISITAGTVPFNGTFKSEGTLYSLNNGQTGNGTWQLRVIDDSNNGSSGSVVSWSITFGTGPAKPLSFTESNLPIVVINTHGQTIPDNPKIIVDMGIIDNGIGVRNHLTDPFNNYSGKVGIEVRGSSSQQFPKKGYSVEIRDTSGINRVDTPILGMPSMHNWVMSAEYSDKSLMHNFLSYQIGREMGHWASRGVYCDVVLDGSYIGVYVFRESIKRDKNRVDIANLHTYDNAWPEISGGYIIKIDKTTGGSGVGWTSPYPPINHSSGETIFYQYDVPNSDSITAQQKTYIQAYVDSFESSLFGPNYMDSTLGYKQYIGNNSFIDYFFADEVSKNVDGYRISTFLHKDKEKTLKCGPFWDYDITYGNANYCSGGDTTGWAYNFPCTGGNQIPQWWPRMLSDSDFANQTKCRWLDLRQNVLSVPHLYAIIDSVANLINESQSWNFQQWPILGIYIWPNVPPYPTTYAGEVSNLKKWIAARMIWMDANMPGNCNCNLAPLTVQDISCNGMCDGSATAIATSPYPKTYSWDNGNPTNAIDFLCPGTYVVSFEDAVGCKRTASVTMIDPAVLSTTTTSVNAGCSGSCTGSATASVSGGTSPYTYSWSPGGGTAPTHSNLCAGNYTVTVTDARGCQTTSSATIAASGVLAFSINATNSVCNSGCIGTADVTVTSGTAPYTYLWVETSETTSSVSNLCAGTYHILVTDAGGCSHTDSVTILQAGGVTLFSSTADASCNGFSNGIASIITGSGTPPFTYAWSTGDTTANAFNLAAGTYTVTVTDSAGCSGIQSVTINEPAPITLSETTVPVICNGQTNGSATVIASGGTVPYTYWWATSGNTTDTDNNLSAGSYNVTVTDANGCPQTTTIIVTEPAPIVFSSSVTDATCTGCSDGTATATATGGTLPYSYLWNCLPPQTTETATNLIAGIYTVTLTDANGCSGADTVTIAEPQALVLSFGTFDISCNGGSDGSITCNVTGGTPPYQYLWTPTGQTTQTAVGLVAGCYTVDVRDFTGATATGQACVTQPPLLVANVVIVTNVTCNGICDGSAVVTVSGGTLPYTYTWDQGTTGTGLCAGSHSVEVRDGNNCVVIVNFVITQPTQVLVSVVVTNNISCAGLCDGSATAVAQGGVSPYSFLWCNGSTAPATNSLCAGICVINVVDANGCAAPPQTIVVTEPPPLTMLVSFSNTTCIGCNDGTTSVSATGGTPGYTYLWSPGGQTTPNITNLAPGTYCVTVTDANGCTLTQCVTVLEDPTGITHISSDNNNVVRVYPNPFKDETKFIFSLKKEQQIVLGIYDVTGKLLKEILNGNLSTGKHEIKFDATDLANGVYNYQFRSDKIVEQGKLIIQR